MINLLRTAKPGKYCEHVCLLSYMAITVDGYVSKYIMAGLYTNCSYEEARYKEADEKGMIGILQKQLGITYQPILGGNTTGSVCMAAPTPTTKQGSGSLLFFAFECFYLTLLYSVSGRVAPSVLSLYRYHVCKDTVYVIVAIPLYVLTGPNGTRCLSVLCSHKCMIVCLLQMC